MKKVVLCVPSLAPGGAERFAVELAKRLDKSRFDVTVAQTRNDVDSVFKEQLAEAGIRIVDLSAPSYSAMLHKQLAFLKAERPDVIHANTGSVLHIMLACWLKRTPRRIYTVHNEARLLFGGKTVKKWIYRLAFSFFGFIPVAICPTVKETLVRDMGVKAKRIPVVNNGVDVARFSPPAEKAPSRTVKFISVGTLYWIKNQAAMIRLVCDLHESGREVTLTLLGEGDDREALEALVHERNAGAYISLPGIRKNVEDYLRDADIYLSTSRTEGLPLSILEAMACGLPVIATDAGGTRDIVHDEENGYLLPVDDEESLARAAIALCEDEKKRQTYGAASRAIAEAWSLTACVEGYSQLYEG